MFDGTFDNLDAGEYDFEGGFDFLQNLFKALHEYRGIQIKTFNEHEPVVEDLSEKVIKSDVDIPQPKYIVSRDQITINVEVDSIDIRESYALMYEDSFNVKDVTHGRVRIIRNGGSIIIEIEYYYGRKNPVSDEPHKEKWVNMGNDSEIQPHAGKVTIEPSTEFITEDLVQQIGDIPKTNVKQFIQFFRSLMRKLYNNRKSMFTSAEIKAIWGEE